MHKFLAHQTVLATGTVTLEVGAEVKIGSRISGQLEKLFVQIGDFVKAGEVIAIVEHDDLKARVARRKAELQAEKARLSKIKPNLQRFSFRLQNSLPVEC